MGYAASTGASFLDYVFADALALPRHLQLTADDAPRQLALNVELGERLDAVHGVDEVGAQAELLSRGRGRLSPLRR